MVYLDLPNDRRIFFFNIDSKCYISKYIQVCRSSSSHYTSIILFIIHRRWSRYKLFWVSKLITHFHCLVIGWFTPIPTHNLLGLSVVLNQGFFDWDDTLEKYSFCIVEFKPSWEGRGDCFFCQFLSSIEFNWIWLPRYIHIWFWK